MRITGNRLMEQAAIATQRQQSRVGELAGEISSGVRVAKPSDDPAAWLAAQRAKLRTTVGDGAADAMAWSRDRLVQTDNALASLHGIVEEARTLAVQASNDSYDATSRKEIALHVRALFASAVAAANTRSPDGEYLLAGADSMTEPFDASGAYGGDASMRGLSSGQVASIPGAELTAAGGVEVIPSLERLAAALEANDKTAITASLGEVTNALRQVGTLRVRSGGMMTILDDAQAAHGLMKQNLAETIATRVESDPLEAASELAKASNALEISRAVSSRIAALLGSH